LVQVISPFKSKMLRMARALPKSNQGSYATFSHLSYQQKIKFRRIYTAAYSWRSNIDKYEAIRQEFNVKASKQVIDKFFKNHVGGS
jgi:hypothetical protein